jgi:hypothetical protein
MSNQLDKKKRTLLEMLKQDREAIDKPRLKKRPSDALVVAAVLGNECILTDEEAETELDRITPDDYDDYILNAINDRRIGRISPSKESTRVEHPTARVFRIGIESIRARKSSQIFIDLLVSIAERAEEKDVLKFVFPETFPKTFKKSQMTSVNEDLKIVKDFDNYVRKNKTLPLNEIKEDFKKSQQRLLKQTDPKKIDRALANYYMDWKAVPGPKKGLTPKKESLNNLCK